MIGVLLTWFFGIPGPYVIDSAKQVFGSTDKYIVDGWGQTTLPNGNFDALRVFETNFEFDEDSFLFADLIFGCV